MRGTHIYILLLIIFTLAGCGNKDYDRMLSNADSLLFSSATTNDNIAQAQLLLDSLAEKESSLTRRQRAHFILLTVQCHNLNYISLASDTTIIQEALHYYDSHGDALKKSQAYYLSGCVNRDQTKIPAAIHQYEEALEMLDKANTQKEYRQLIKIHSQLAYAYGLMQMPDRNIDNLMKAGEYAKLCRDTLSLIYSISNMTSPYFFLNQEDSLIAVTQRSYNLFLKYGHEDKASGELFPIVYIYLKRGDAQSARIWLERIEKNKKIIDDNGNVSDRYASYYAYKGKYYLLMSQLDSAEYYLRKMQKHTNNIDNSQATYQGLFELYERIGTKDSIVKYARLWCEANDSSVINNASQELQHIRSMYDYKKYEEMANVKSMELSRLKVMIAIGIILLTIAISTLLYIYRQRKKVTREREQRLKQLYASAIEDYERLKHRSDKLVTDREAELENMRLIIESIKGKDNKFKQWDSESTMKYSSEVKRLHDYAFKGTAPDILWRDVIALAWNFIPSFMEQINNSQNTLSVDEQRLVLLLRLKFNLTEIQNLLAKSPQALTNMRAKVNKKLFNVANAPTLDANLMKL